MKAFTQRAESNLYPPVVYVVSWKRKCESWLPAPCKGGQGDALEEVPVGSFILTHNALHLFERHKDRKCDPGLITVWAAISENSEQRADKEVSVRLPLACFVRCGSMNVSLCVKNGQFALSSCHVESVTKKTPLHISCKMTLNSSYSGLKTHFPSDKLDDKDGLFANPMGS